uniref:Sulfatase N-terminal domain-containing protein n=1 Tax=Romanomermis culicivorax TaxID=13658 RepID=A0A915L817_ROMCU
MADEIYAKFFREMFDQGFFNKTIVFFFGDHGHRFNEIRQTLIGSFEEHNPMFGLWFPEWFYEQHPHLKGVLRYNTDRYSSTFDVHETLKDILNEEYDTPVQNPKLKRGLSLLRKLPEKRTCKQAGVPDRYCLCKEENPIDVGNDTVVEAAESTIKILNQILNAENIVNKCHKIVLHAILDATSIDYDQNWGQGHDHLNKLKLILATKPNKAIFEAILGKNILNSTENEWTLVGEIERIIGKVLSFYAVDRQIRKQFETKSGTEKLKRMVNKVSVSRRKNLLNRVNEPFIILIESLAATLLHPLFQNE